MKKTYIYIGIALLAAAGIYLLYNHYKPKPATAPVTGGGTPGNSIPGTGIPAHITNYAPYLMNFPPPANGIIAVNQAAVTNPAAQAQSITNVASANATSVSPGPARNFSPAAERSQGAHAWQQMKVAGTDSMVHVLAAGAPKMNASTGVNVIG